MSQPGPPAPRDQLTADREQEFGEEVRSAVAYERGLAVKCVCCIVLVAIVLAARVYLFG